MNKKYYAKYLPVPNGYRRIVKVKGIPVDVETEVKLYLLKNDVPKAGNIVLYKEDNYQSVVVELVNNSCRDVIIEKMPKDREGGTLDYRELVIIVGEILTTGVKEFEEFDEEEIKLLTLKT